VVRTISLSVMKVFIASLILVGARDIPLAARCGPELAERVAMPDSSWVVVTQVFRCSAIDPGGMEIVAEDKETGQRVDLLVLNGEEDSQVEYVGPHRVQITLPNLVAIKSQKFSFGAYDITYRYLPADDPEARLNFQKWVENPKDPAANKWYEENILSKFHPAVPGASK
jgi:putative component of membrane protein insertase Oxa1/YidC/SpoIIIJ protein YidD